MAKEGIDSFLLDCHTNENLAEIEAAFGIKGFAVIVRLWQKIYSEKGYYCEWHERSPLLFLATWFGGNSGIDLNLITEVVSSALRIGIFDQRLYEEYSILTSEGIQKRYFEVVKRRAELTVIEEYLLVSVSNFKGNVCKKSISADKKAENACRNDTSKGKESKAKERKENNTDICSEQQAASEPPVITLLLNTGGEYPITQKDINEWMELYPAVDVMQELRAMKGWCKDNPRKRKTAGGIRRFVNSWLAKEQNRGGTPGYSSGPGRNGAGQSKVEQFAYGAREWANNG